MGDRATVYRSRLTGNAPLQPAKNKGQHKPAPGYNADPFGPFPAKDYGGAHSWPYLAVGIQPLQAKFIHKPQPEQANEGTANGHKGKQYMANGLKHAGIMRQAPPPVNSPFPPNITKYIAS